MGIISEEQYRVCRQHKRNQYVRLTILNKQNFIIGQIESKVIDGSISITNDSYLRRSANLKLKLDSQLLPKQQTFLWLNNMLRLEIGIQNLLSNEIIWFKEGIFLYKSNQMNYSATEKSIDLTLIDKMCRFSGDIYGFFENNIKLSTQTTPIDESIRHIVKDLGGENNILIENFTDNSGNTLMLPYTLTANAGDNMLNSIKTLVELYKYHTCYYNVDGFFVAEHTKTLLNDDIKEDFRDIDYTITSQVTNDYSYVKNFVKVLGIFVEPLVSVEDIESPSNQTPVNSSTTLKIFLNKPLYDSNGSRFSNSKDVKSYFTYNGTASNFTSAIYNDSDWSITFLIVGENGKILKALPNMIYDSCQIPFDDGGYVYSTTDTKWARILVATVITDGINNQIKFELNFNKPLYKSGVAITTGTSLKSSFYYADGSGNTNNFLDAIYTIDNTNYYITLTFANAVPNATIQINRDGATNVNSVYDNAGLIYRTESYIMNGTTWTLIEDDSSLLTTYQVTTELSNTDNTSPYSVDNLGEKRVLVINDQNIYTKSQCDSRAEWELQLHSNLNETINLTCLALYYLDVDMLIYLYNKELNVDGKYKIDKISFSLKEGTMSLTVSKIFM